jgi:hypothetical protein
VCAELHYNTCKEIGVQSENEQRYDPLPKLVERGDEGTVTIEWDQRVKTDTNVPVNKQNILIRDYEKGTRLLIDNDLSGDKNVVNKKLRRS